MRPAGLREVERAKQDGRWEAAYASQSKIEVPADRIHDAKRAETRARRIEKFVAMLARGEKIH